MDDLSGDDLDNKKGSLVGEPFLRGGDGGSWTRVRNIRPETSTGLVALLYVIWRTPCNRIRCQISRRS